MKNPSSFRLLFLALVVCALLGVETRADDNWTRVRSQNFDLIGNASDKEIRRVATKLEQFREVFRILFPRLKFNASVPTQVIVFKNGKSFKPYKPIDATGKPSEWVAGYFQKTEDMNYIVLSTEGETQQTYKTIFHEYVHLLLDNSFGKLNIPPWFHEGIAEYYDEFLIENDQNVTLGGLNHGHLLTLHRSKLIPLETFFATDYRSLNQKGSHSASIFYAQAWAFMHYLFHRNAGANSGQVNAFATEVLNNRDPKEAFERIFQMDYATMERELRAYVQQRSLPIRILELKNKLSFETSMTSSPVPSHLAKGTLGDLLMHSNQLDSAESHLKEALTGDPNSAAYNASLAMVRMKQKRVADAKPLLEKALLANSKNHLVYYRYATILMREAFTENNVVTTFTDSDAKKMRDALNKAIELEPSFSRSYAQLAFIGLVRNERLDESITHIQKALSLSPGNEHYVLHLAGLYARKSEFDRAQSLAESVLGTASENDVRARAEHTIRSIEANRRVAEFNKQTGGVDGSTTARLVTIDKPLTDAELAELNLNAEIEGINRALRKPKDNEKRILAHLQQISCNENGVLYSVKAGDTALRLRTKDLQEITWVSFAPVAKKTIGCGELQEPVFAVLTYIESVDKPSMSVGELVAVETVPETFKLQN